MPRRSDNQTEAGLMAHATKLKLMQQTEMRKLAKTLRTIASRLDNAAAAKRTRKTKRQTATRRRNAR